MKASNTRQFHSVNVGALSPSNIKGEIRSKMSCYAMTDQAEYINVGIMDSTNMYHRSALRTDAGGSNKPGLSLGSGSGTADVHLYRSGISSLVTNSQLTVTSALHIINAEDGVNHVSLHNTHTTPGMRYYSGLFSNGNSGAFGLEAPSSCNTVIQFGSDTNYESLYLQSTAWSGSAKVSTTRMTIKGSTGFVGIGTAVPAFILHTSTADTSGVMLQTTSVSDSVILNLAGNSAIKQRFLPGLAGGTFYNWQLDAQSLIDGGFSITPSTTAGGSTFTNPGLTIQRTGAVSIPGTLSITGALDVDGTTLFVDATNNRVGIKTSSPQSPLDVRGDINVAQFVGDSNNDTRLKLFLSSETRDGNNGFLIKHETSKSYIGTLSSIPLGLITGGSTRVTISTAGLVGIGTETPLGLLHLESATPEIIFKDTDADTGRYWKIAVQADSGSESDLNFLCKSGGGYVSSMFLDNSGNVGIGRVDPSYRISTQLLTSNTSGVQDIAQISSLSSGTPDNSFGAGLLFQVQAPNTNSYNIARIAGVNNPDGSSALGDLALYTLNSGILFERLRVSGYGNVGIGTNAPGYILHTVTSSTSGVMFVAASGSDSVVLNLASYSGVSQRFLPDSDGGTKYNWQLDANVKVDQAFSITPSTAVGGSTYSNTALTILQTGFIGINTSSPTAYLNVAGTNYIPESGGYASGGINLQTEATTGAGSYTSGLSFTMTALGGSAAIAGIQGTADPDQVGLSFFTHTSATGSASSVEAMRLTYTGDLDLGTNKLQFGSAIGTNDVNLYRSTTSTLKTDGSFAASTLVLSQNSTVTSTIVGTASQLRLKGYTTNNAVEMEFYTSGGAIRGYVGFHTASNSTFTISNQEDGLIGIVRNGTKIAQFDTSNDLDLGSNKLYFGSTISAREANLYLGANTDIKTDRNMTVGGLLSIPVANKRILFMNSSSQITSSANFYFDSGLILTGTFTQLGNGAVSISGATSITDSISIDNIAVGSALAATISQTVTLSGNIADARAVQISSRLEGTNSTVTRFNVIDVPNYTASGLQVLTDMCVFRYDANAGSHKALSGGTTKSSPGVVDAWRKENINGTIHYGPLYLSKTS